MAYREIGPFGNSESGRYEYAVANGGDGKYEDHNGKKRLHWNFYHLNSLKMFTKQNQTGQYPSSSYIPLFNDGWEASDQNALLQKLAGNVKGHDFNLAVNLAQGKQTVDMVVGTLKSLGLAALDAKRGNFGSAIRRFGASPRGKKSFSSKDISGRWLELQYGWLPSLSDSYEAAKAYEQITKSRKQTYKATKSRVMEFNGSTSFPNYNFSGKAKLSRQIIAEIEEEISAPRSLGLYDPLSVAWEVLPWSFVIDWFVPIGSYLDNLSIIPSLEGRFLSTSRLDGFQASELLGVNLDPPIPPDVSYYGSSRIMEHYDLLREVSSSLEVPFPSIQGIPSAMSPKRIWNAIALGHQRFR